MLWRLCGVGGLCRAELTYNTRAQPAWGRALQLSTNTWTLSSLSPSVVAYQSSQLPKCNLLKQQFSKSYYLEWTQVLSLETATATHRERSPVAGSNSTMQKQVMAVLNLAMQGNSAYLLLARDEDEPWDSSWHRQQKPANLLFPSNHLHSPCLNHNSWCDINTCCMDYMMTCTWSCYPVLKTNYLLHKYSTGTTSCISVTKNGQICTTR